MLNNEEFQKLMLEKISSISDEMSIIKGEMKTLREGQTSIQNKLEGVENRLGNVEGRLENVENRLEDMEVKNANRHLEIESKLETLMEDNKSVREILGGHEVDIRTLRRKFV